MADDQPGPQGSEAAVFPGGRPTVASLTPSPLVGEPAGDKAYLTPSGTKIRVRTVVAEEGHAGAPTKGSPQLAPTYTKVVISLALLDEQDEVARDAEGRLIIIDRHEITLQESVMEGRDFDIAECMDRNLREQAYVLEKVVGRRSSITSYFAEQWGGAALPVEEMPEPFIPPLPAPVEPDSQPDAY